MAVSWASIVDKTYRAFKKDGMPLTIIVISESTAYNITTGKRSAPVRSEYVSHGFIQNYETKDLPNIGPDDIEISFHAGTSASPLPDLSNSNKIQIKAGDKTYQVINIKAVRPAGLTMMYKARARES